LTLQKWLNQSTVGKKHLRKVGSHGECRKHQNMLYNTY
jgi:hypothetical protein